MQAETTSTVIVVVVDGTTCGELLPPLEEINLDEALEPKQPEDDPLERTDYLGVDRLDTPIRHVGPVREFPQLESTYG